MTKGVEGDGNSSVQLEVQVYGPGERCRPGDNDIEVTDDTVGKGEVVTEAGKVSQRMSPKQNHPLKGTVKEEKPGKGSKKEAEVCPQCRGIQTSPNVNNKY